MPLGRGPLSTSVLVFVEWETKQLIYFVYVVVGVCFCIISSPPTPALGF